MRLESLQGGRPEMQQTLERAEKFLNLVALLAALLCAVAVAIAARGFAQRHLDDCAMLRVLVLSQASMARAYTLEFALVGLFASALGVALGYAVHHAFVILLAGLVEASLPAPSLAPVALGLGMGLTLMFSVLTLLGQLVAVLRAPVERLHPRPVVAGETRHDVARIQLVGPLGRLPIRPVVRLVQEGAEIALLGVQPLDQRNGVLGMVLAPGDDGALGGVELSGSPGRQEGYPESECQTARSGIH